MTDSQDPRRTRAIVPLHLQAVHHENLRYAQVVRVRVELYTRERFELDVKKDLSETALDISIASRDRHVLFGGQNFLLQRSIIPISRDTQRTGRDPIQSAAEVCMVRVEPIRTDRSAGTGTNFAR